MPEEKEKIHACMRGAVHRFIDYERTKRSLNEFLMRKKMSGEELEGLTRVLDEPIAALETTQRDCEVNLSEATSAARGIRSILEDTRGRAGPKEEVEYSDAPRRGVEENLEDWRRRLWNI